jgi:hypothetical protein
MGVKYRRCCGIDVHKKSVTVCVLPPRGKTENGVAQEEFSDLYAGSKATEDVAEEL